MFQASNRPGSSRLPSRLWPEIDRGLLEETRPRPVPFPLELLPDTRRTWVERSAQVFTPVNYHAQGLLGAVAAACAGGIVVRVTPQLPTMTSRHSRLHVLRDWSMHPPHFHQRRRTCRW
jgi:hypothetical protein